MPVNYEQLRKQMKTAGKTLKLRQDAFSRATEEYEEALLKEARSVDLKERIESALAEKPDVRCAVPMQEPADSVHPLVPMPQVKIRLLACDGSQITPSRHDEISFGLINTAVVEYIIHSGRTPQINTSTELLPFDDLPTEDMVGVRRDAAEKKALAETAADSAQEMTTFAFCDGPLELFSKTPEVKEYEKFRKIYLKALTDLASLRVPAVGYIDRPGSDPVLQMLDLAGHSREPADPKMHPNDSMLFSRLLQPGERSAVFGLHSGSNQELSADLQTCFFYMNIGRHGHPYISRVEFPAWSADGTVPDLLHAVLNEQCRLLGGHPYPFILHRAHECAVITIAEKEEIKGLLLREMAVNGMKIPEKSNKQIAKDNSRLG